MKETFRLSMLWLHTWAGVVLGGLLFAIFWMGSLSVFNQEIDRWMMPETRIQPPADFSLDAFAAQQAETRKPGTTEWFLVMPRERIPFAYYRTRDTTGVFSAEVRLDLATGAFIPESETLAGTGFIFPFHFMLHLGWKQVGYWIVGGAGMAMMLLLISGVVVHVRLFKDYFTFRPKKKLARSTLDLHNLSGVLVLPFHFMIALTGVVIFMNIYFPQSAELAYADEEVPRTAFFSEAYESYAREPAGMPATTTASLDAMWDVAVAEWGVPPYLIRSYHLGDASAYISMRRGYQDHVHYDRNVLYFDAATGEVLHHFVTAPVMTAQHFLIGLHLIQFDHWGLRWLYFLAGLAGCVLIGTGFVYWFEKRRSKHAELSQTGLRLVEVLTIGSVTGIMVATVAFFVANRVLPLGLELWGMERAIVEMRLFYLVWLATFAHVALRRWFGAPMAAVWRDQLWVLAVLSVVAPILNAVTTGAHMVQTLTEGQWAVFGMDALLLVTAVLSVVLARRLGQKAASVEKPMDRVTPRPKVRTALRSIGRPRAGAAAGDGPATGDGAPAGMPETMRAPAPGRQPK
ncbi:MAG: PepSY-associated TM helix domain-containing protein [Bacteroidota bacterium]